jgi:hypothetical protein
MRYVKALTPPSISDSATEQSVLTEGDIIMSSLSYLIARLGSSVIRTQIRSKKEVFFNDIAFAEVADSFVPDCLYVSTAVTADELAKNSRMNGMTLFTSGMTGVSSLEEAEGVSFVATDQPLIELFAVLSGLIRKQNEIDKLFMKSLYENGSLEALLLTAGSVLNAGMMLLDANMAILGQPDDDVSSSPEKKSTSKPSVQSRESADGSARKVRTATSRKRSRTSFFTFSDASGQTLHLVAILEGEKSDCDVMDILNLCSGYIKQLNVSGCGANNSTGRFHRFLTSVLSGSVRGDNDIIEAFVASGFVHNNDRRFFRILIAEHISGEAVSDGSAVLSALSDALDVVGGTVFQGQLIALIAVSPADRCKVTRLESVDCVLKGYSLRACFSANLPIFFLKLHYGLVTRALKLDRVLKYSQSTSYFFAEQYSVQIFCDLCAEKFGELFGSVSPTSILDQGIYVLYRYDKLNNSNLNLTLYHYLLNGGNLIKTAEGMYMHKNTVLYKLKKIRTLLLEDIDETSFQTRLLFSYMLLRYIEDYMGGEIKILDSDVDYPIKGAYHQVGFVPAPGTTEQRPKQPVSI